MALTTVDYVKTVSNIVGTTYDAQISALLDAASAEIKAYLGIEVEQATYTEYYTGNNTTRLALRQIPVTSITSVSIKSDGYFDQKSPGFGAEDVITEGVGYVLDRSPGVSLSKSGILFRIGTVWPMLNRVYSMYRLTTDLGPTWGNIKVVYTAGYATVPNDIQLACAMLTNLLRNTLPHGGRYLEAEKLKDWSYRLATVKLDTGGLPELGSIRGLLAPYKQMGW